jgi:hypothetical protein
VLFSPLEKRNIEITISTLLLKIIPQDLSAICHTFVAVVDRDWCKDTFASGWIARICGAAVVVVACLVPDNAPNTWDAYRELALQEDSWI